MTLSHFAIQGLVPFIKGDDNSPRRTGRELVTLFNTYGSRDVYDTNGLPADTKKKDGTRMSRNQYVENRLLQLSGNDNLRLLLEQVLNEADNKGYFTNKFNELLEPEGFNVIENEGHYSIQGGVIDRTLPVQNEAHFQDIQDRILIALDNARVSIWLAMAWFTNVTLFNKLVEKSGQGIGVELVIFNDGVNRTHGVDFAQLNHSLIRATRGGTMHNKFCVIDNQIVITGSYNWTNNAEFRNDENITIERDPAQATTYSEEFRRLKPIQN
jgi:phosphatidylserine/phosphatidylglycerophosphate/cardiolipin synthase-like enzyme